MKFLSPAKLNLNLRIISKRGDGFHNLETTFQLINLFDEISFKESNKSSSISCEGMEIEAENNLIFKSFNAIKKHCKVDKGIQIHLKKIIPEYMIPSKIIFLSPFSMGSFCSVLSHLSSGHRCKRFLK